MDIELSKLTDGKEDLFIRKWEGTIIPKLKEIASLEKKNDIRHLLEKADNQQDGMIFCLNVCYTFLNLVLMRKLNVNVNVQFMIKLILF